MARRRVRPYFDRPPCSAEHGVGLCHAEPPRLASIRPVRVPVSVFQLHIDVVLDLGLDLVLVLDFTVDQLVQPLEL